MKKFLLFILLCVGGLFVGSQVSAATINVSPSGTGFTTIQSAINAANPGDTVYVEDGMYNETLNINKSITLQGNSRNLVKIDASGLGGGYGIAVTADNVKLKRFTLQNTENASSSDNGYGIKVSGSGRLNDFLINNVTVKDSARTNLDLNGVDGAIIKNSYFYDAISGNGITLTNTKNAELENNETAGNAWGGIAIYASPKYSEPAGAENNLITGHVFDEVLGLYSQATGGTIDNTTADQFKCVVSYDDIVVSDPGDPVVTTDFKNYFETVNEAETFLSNNPGGSIDCGPATIVMTKYACPEDTVVDNDWKADENGDITADTSECEVVAGYGLGNDLDNTNSPSGATYMPTNFETLDVTDGSGMLSVDVEPGDYLVGETFEGSWVAHDEMLGMVCNTAPENSTRTNNIEAITAETGKTTHCTVVNIKEPDPVPVASPECEDGSMYARINTEYTGDMWYGDELLAANTWFEIDGAVSSSIDEGFVVEYDGTRLTTSFLSFEGDTETVYKIDGTVELYGATHTDIQTVGLGNADSYEADGPIKVDFDFHIKGGDDVGSMELEQLDVQCGVEPVVCDGNTYATLQYGTVNITFDLVSGYDDGSVAISQVSTGTYEFVLAPGLGEVDGTLTLQNSIVDSLDLDFGGGDMLEQSPPSDHTDIVETNDEYAIDFALESKSRSDTFGFTTTHDQACFVQEATPECQSENMYARVVLDEESDYSEGMYFGNKELTAGEWFILDPSASSSNKDEGFVVTFDGTTFTTYFKSFEDNALYQIEGDIEFYGSSANNLQEISLEGGVYSDLFTLSGSNVVDFKFSITSGDDGGSVDLTYEQALCPVEIVSCDENYYGELTYNDGETVAFNFADGYADGNVTIQDNGNGGFTFDFHGTGSEETAFASGTLTLTNAVFSGFDIAFNSGPTLEYHNVEFDSVGATTGASSLPFALRIDDNGTNKDQFDFTLTDAPECLGDGGPIDNPGEPVCGNEIVEGEEQCDDGNNIDGDGCSSTCQIEEEGDVVTFGGGQGSSIGTTSFGGQNLLDTGGDGDDDSQDDDQSDDEKSDDDTMLPEQLLTTGPDSVTEACDEDTYILRRHEQLSQEDDAVIRSVPQELANRLGLNHIIKVRRFVSSLTMLETAEKNDTVRTVVCEIEKIKADRNQRHQNIGYDYSDNTVDYILQYIQDLVILAFEKDTEIE